MLHAKLTTMAHPYDALRESELRKRFSNKWRKYPPDVLPAFVAEMDFPVAPAITAAMQRAVDNYDFGYPPDAANIGLTDIVVQWLSTTQGYAPDRDNVMVISDVVKGLEVGVRSLSQPSDGVIVCPPIYSPFLNVCNDIPQHRVDVALLRDPDGAWRFDVAGIDAAMAAGATVLLLCHPHNPTGSVWTADQLDELVAVARRHGAHIVSDEVHGPLTYAPQQHIALATRPGAAELTLTLTSASKAWNLAGLKCAFAIAGTEEIRERVLGSPRGPRVGIGILGELATMAALTDGQDWLADTLAYLDTNRRWLADNLPPGIDCRMPEATYLAWLDCRALALQPTAGAHFLEHAKVAMNAGEDYGAGFEGWARINFAASRPMLGEILERMAASLPR